MMQYVHVDEWRAAMVSVGHDTLNRAKKNQVLFRRVCAPTVLRPVSRRPHKLRVGLGKRSEPPHQIEIRNLGRD